MRAHAGADGIVSLRLALCGGDGLPAVTAYSSVACSGSGSAGSISSGPLLRTLLTSRDTSRISIRSRSPCPRSRPSSMGASGSSQRSQSCCADRQRHAVVDLGERPGRVGGDDRGAQQRLAVLGRTLGPPCRPQARHEQRLAVGAVHVERRLRALLAAPFVPAVHRHQAALALRGIAECGRGGDLLRARVDQQRALGVRAAVLGVLGPRRNQPPPHQPHPARRLVVGLAVAFDDRADRGGRGDVVVRAPERPSWPPRSLSSIAWIFSASSAGSVVTANRPHIHPMVAETADKAGWTAVSTWQAPTSPSPVHATVTVPGSKSQTNRALVLAALATPQGPSTISGALRSRDTDLMIDAVRTLGVDRRRRRHRAGGQRPDRPARGRPGGLRSGGHGAAVRSAGRGARHRDGGVRRRRAGPCPPDRAAAGRVARTRCGHRRRRPAVLGPRWRSGGTAAPSRSTRRRHRSSSPACCCPVRRSPTG